MRKLWKSGEKPFGNEGVGFRELIEAWGAGLLSLHLSLRGRGSRQGREAEVRATAPSKIEGSDMAGMDPVTIDTGYQTAMGSPQTHFFKGTTPIPSLLSMLGIWG